MSFSEELIRHAVKLLGNPASGHVSSTDRRRAISAAYYALFHHISEQAVLQIAPELPPVTANRIHRWLDHAEIKRICREFVAVPLTTPLRELLGDATSFEMRSVAMNFIKLQEARHRADYDLLFEVGWKESWELVQSAVNAIGDWNRIAPSPETNIFVLSLLLWKEWESSRK